MSSKQRSSSEAAGLRLTYIIGTYPSLTTTFIDREIIALRAAGVDVRVVSIRRTTGVLSAEQQALQEAVTYLLPVVWVRLLLSHMYFSLRHARRYFATLCYLASRTHPTEQARWMTLLHFGEGVYAAYLIRNHACDALHAHFAERAATVTLVMSRLLGKPYSLSIHAGPDIFVQPVLVGEKIEHAAHVVTCTHANQRQVESIVGPELGRKIICVHHGLDLERYQATPVNAIPQPVIVSVGQLAERKGFAVLIAACRLLRDQGYTFVCRIIGQGPLHGTLATQIRQLGLEETVHLCGALPHEAVIEEYRCATVFALACQRSTDGDMDGLPNVLAEAMSMQLPVVSSAISAIPELVEHEVSGLLVPPHDPAALAAALGRLLDDASLRDRLGKHARRTVTERFDSKRNVARLAALLWPDWFPSPPQPAKQMSVPPAPGYVAESMEYGMTADL
ncbi:MAG TPA: glycosyltransferase [Herpetosiphonaceae bacterium]